MKKLFWGILIFSLLGCNQISGINDLTFDTTSTDSATQDSETGSGVAIGINAEDTSSETSTTLPTTDSSTETSTSIQDTNTINDSDTITDIATDTPSDVAKELTLASSTIPSGKYNEIFEFEFKVTGGKAPYTLAAIAGSLPAGVAISNGLLVGRPVQSGNYTFTLRVTDSLNAVTSAEFSWEVHRNKWVGYRDSSNNIQIYNMADGSIETVFTAAAGKSAQIRGFSALGNNFLYTVEADGLTTLYVTTVTDSGKGGTAAVISGSEIRQPKWTPDGKSFVFSLRENSGDTNETVYWGGPGKASVAVDTIAIGNYGLFGAPIDNDTIFYMSMQEAWVVDVVNGVVNVSTKKVVTLPDMPSTPNAILLKTVELGDATALEINWLASPGGPCSDYVHYVVKEDATAYYLGRGCGDCFQHSADYDWYFIPNSQDYGTSIVEVENQGNKIDIFGGASHLCGYNVQWDEASQYVAYFEYTSPYAVQMQNLTTIPYTKSEMAVNGVDFSAFGGLSPDGTKILANSLTTVYGANITSGTIGSPQVISPDLGTEEVKVLSISPSGDYAAYIGYVYESSAGSGNVYIADLNQMTHQRSCLNETTQNTWYPSPLFIKFSPDGSALFFVVESKTTSQTYFLYTVDLLNKTNARSLSKVGISSPELHF